MGDDGGRTWGDITRAKRAPYVPGKRSKRRAKGKRGLVEGAGTDPATVVKYAAQAALFVQVQRERAKRRPGGLPSADAGAARLRRVRMSGGPSVQCSAAKRDGARCGSSPMRGASRCWVHGGCEQAPDMPAAARAYLAGRLPLGRLRRWADHPSAKHDAALAEWVRSAGAKRRAKRRAKNPV